MSHSFSSVLLDRPNNIPVLCRGGEEKREKTERRAQDLGFLTNPNPFVSLCKPLPFFSRSLGPSVQSRIPNCRILIRNPPPARFSGKQDKKTMVLWVFGYGSLVWNPGFDFDEKIIGFIKDYRRVFDLACIDHRGTPEHPARTCTLEAKEGAVCWGAAFCVKGGIEKERAAMQYLEKRECEYDTKSSVDFYKEGDDLTPAVTGVLVFTSTPDKETNKYYLGPAPLEEMARQIATAHGPCGNNRDYLFMLEKAMFDIGHEEDYVIELANEVRKELGRLKEKKAAGAHIALKAHLPLMNLPPLQETTVVNSSW